MRWISTTYIGGIFVLMVVVWRHVVTGQPIYHFTRDPAALAGMSPSTGVLSNMGVVLWMATAALCLLTSAVLPSGRERGFLFCAAVLSAALGADDLLQLHEVYYPRVGLSEKVVYAAYMFAVAAWLTVYRRIIRSTRFVTLAIALATFAFGLAADQLHDPEARWHHLYEDGAKWMGIVGWSAFFAHTCYTWLTRAVRREQQLPEEQVQEAPTVAVSGRERPI